MNQAGRAVVVMTEQLQDYLLRSHDTNTRGKTPQEGRGTYSQG